MWEMSHAAAAFVKLVNPVRANPSPHSEFVKRATGELPAGAWVGTVSKLDGRVAAISSKHFFGYQLPAPPEVAEVVRRTFE